MGGGGSLDAMNKSIQSNRALLNRKTLFEQKNNRRYEKSQTKGETYKEAPADKKVLSRVRNKMLAQRRRQLFLGSLIFMIVASAIGYLIFATMNGPVVDSPFQESVTVNKEYRPFRAVESDMGDGRTMRKEYFNRGYLSAKTIYVGGLRHGESQSYYMTGERFRLATYANDTVVSEKYYYKDGREISNFPWLLDSKVYKVSLNDTEKKKHIYLEFYEGKILTYGYEETPY